MFEGVPARVPYAYTQILVDEYSSESLYHTEFHNHTFDTKQGHWQQVMQPVDRDEEKTPKDGAYS